MQPTQLELKGLHLPDSISWWPPALGWWLLVVGGIVLIVLFYQLIRYLIRKTPVKTAKILLAGIKQNKQLDNAQKVRELSVLLRRVAISIAPETDVAGLTGAAWLAFLDAPLQTPCFSTGIGACLADAPYRRVVLSDADLAQLITLCENWLKRCAKPVRRPSKQVVKGL